MKIATWNVNSLKARLDAVKTWLTEASPDVVCLQEIKTTDEGFPAELFESLGYNCAVHGQKSYNGVAILSKTPLTDVAVGLPGLVDDHRRVIAGSLGNLRIISVYCPNGQSVGSDKYQYKLRWFAALHGWLKGELARHPRLAIMGDFNVAPEDRDVYDPKAWEGSVLVSEPERAAFRALLDLGLKDSFRLFEQPEKTYSWWDYRVFAFRRNMGLRIDHILLSGDLARSCRSSTIDREPRKRVQPSDHAPAVAEIG